MASPLRALGRSSSSRRPGQGEKGASHLVKKHHRGFDDLPPFLEFSIVVLLLGLQELGPFCVRLGQSAGGRGGDQQLQLRLMDCPCSPTAKGQRITSACSVLCAPPPLACVLNQKHTKTICKSSELCLWTSHKGLRPGQGQWGCSPGDQDVGVRAQYEGSEDGGKWGKRPRLPFLEPQALPSSEGLGGVFQHPEFVEEHHIEEDQQH